MNHKADITCTLMPVGKYREQPINTLTTTFLCWFVSQDNMRFKYSDATRAALAELRKRFLEKSRVETELLPPSDYADLI